jgi:hypothetical protein
MVHHVHGRISVVMDLEGKSVLLEVFCVNYYFVCVCSTIGVSSASVYSMLQSYSTFLKNFESSRVVLISVQDTKEVLTQNKFSYKIFRMKQGRLVPSLTELMTKEQSSIGKSQTTLAAQYSDELHQSRRSLVTYRGGDIFGDLLHSEKWTKVVFEYD